MSAASNPVARPVLQGWQVVSEESRGTKSKTLFYNLCYQNPMDNVCLENNFLVCHKDQG